MSQRDTPDDTNPSGTTPKSIDSALPQSVSENDEYTYACPYCDASYEKELLTRVHATRSDDHNHLNQNGFMPETEIQVISPKGEVTETVSRRPEEIDTSEITLDAFPDDISDQHKHILVVAASNPYETTYTTLAEHVEKRLADYDIDPPSYSTIRRVIRQFFRPQTDGETPGRERGKNPETLTELTAKQQAIIIAHLCSPEASPTTIAQQISCAKSYPPQVFELATPITNNLQTRIEEGEDPRDVLITELTKEDIRELTERGLLDDVPIDVEPLISDVEDQDGATWGSPRQHHGGMTARPQELEQQSEATDTDSTQQARLTEASESTSKSGTLSSGGSSDQISETDARKTVPRSEIEELRDKVRFLREVFECDSIDDENNLLIGFTRHFEQRCDEILRTSREDI